MTSARARSICLGAVGALVASTAVASEGVEPVRLAYRAPDECPALEGFLAEVRRSVPRMRVARPDETARLFSVAIDDDGRHGRLTIEGEGRPHIRNVDGANCAEVSQLLAFATALAVDPDAVVPTDVRVPASPGEIRATPAESPASDLPANAGARASSDTPSFTSWSFGGYALAESAAAPNPLFGGGVFGGVSRKIGPIRPLARIGIAYAASSPAVVDSANATVSFAAILGLLEACPTSWGTPRVSFRPCLRAEGGIRETTGHAIPGARTELRPWVALGAVAHVRWLMAWPVFAEIGGGAVFPVVRDRVLLDPGIPVHEVPWIGAVGEFALGVTFGDQPAN